MITDFTRGATEVATAEKTRHQTHATHYIEKDSATHMALHFLRRRVPVLLLTTGLVAGSLAVVQPAVAVDDPQRLGDLIMTPTSGTTPEYVTPPFPGVPHFANWVESLSTNEGEVCPAGLRSRSNLIGFVNGTQYSAPIASAIRSTIDYAPYGIGGVRDGDTHIFRTGEFAFATSSGVMPSLIEHGGTIEFRHTCQAGTFYAPATDKYYSVTVTMQPGGAWEVVNGEAPTRADTTTSVHESNVTATSATLTATVDPAAATGTVTFTSGAIAKTADVVNGVAIATVEGLAPNQVYAFEASYSGDASHKESKGNVSFTTAGAADGAESGIEVTVPTAESDEPKGLKLTSKPGNVTLANTTEARKQGQPWTAAGTLTDVVVNDDRRNAAAKGWTLSGQAQGFSGAGSIPASALSWSGATGGTGFVAGTLDQSRVLSTGVASGDADRVTTITGTRLELVVPATAAAGNYSSKLTLTLI